MPKHDLEPILRVVPVAKQRVGVVQPHHQRLLDSAGGDDAGRNLGDGGVAVRLAVLQRAVVQLAPGDGDDGLVWRQRGREVVVHGVFSLSPPGGGAPRR